MRILFTFVLLLSFSITAQRTIDVVKYEMTIHIEDTTDVINVNEFVTIDFLEDVASFELDLVSIDLAGLGMKVLSLTENGEEVKFNHLDDKLEIFTKRGVRYNQSLFKIHYQGIPKDGLIIGHNKYGKRTFFGDNWPNRAKNWIACVDHPSDKALVRFSVIAPKHYSVIANGGLKVFSPFDSIHNLTTYISRYSIPMKVMVFGAADFAHEEIENKNNFPLENWVYQEDSLHSFSDLEVVLDPLNFYIQKIAPYPFLKLANVQSTTQFGGMENAGCIFYDEEAFSGKNKMENLIAHEIAHQWFGNSASETDWQHLWLSEGFATYMTNCYLENKYGKKAMNEQLQLDREKIIQFESVVKRPVIDTITENLMDLLNPNSYQKGSWFLHMLRNKLGDKAFWKGLQQYYETYKYSNASTDDFRKIMESQSETSLKSFFDQWLKSNVMPSISVNIGSKKCKKRKVILTQTQDLPFFFPLEVEITSNGKKKIFTVQFTPETKSVELNVNVKSKSNIRLDPNTKLLFRESPSEVLLKQ